MKLFKKKYKVRVRRSVYGDSKRFYVEYTYHRFFSSWKVVQAWLPNALVATSFNSDRERAEEFAKQLESIDKLKRYNKNLQELIHKHDKYYETKIIHSK